MRVLIANNTCKLGGVSTFMLSLRAALSRAGHTAELFFLEHGPMEAQLPPGVPVHFGTLPDLLQLIRRKQIEVVHGNNSDWVAGLSAVRYAGAKLVLTAHKVREPVWTHGWTTRNCDAFVAVSEWIRTELRRYTDLPIQVVRNGVDMDHFTSAERAEDGPPIVAWVGRGGIPRKRLETFAAIAPALRRAGFRIWVIDPQGPSELSQRQPEAARLLSECAHIWHGVPFESMPEHYRRIAASGGCVVSTASMEGLPLGLIEAQACGCLVIAADAQGVNECVSPLHGGILYPPSTPADQLAAIICESLRDRPLVRKRQAEAAAHVRCTFSLTRMAEDYLRIYRESPYRPAGWAPQPLAARLRLSPVLHPRAYVRERWSTGVTQYQSARELAARGEWSLAASALEAAVRTAPTILLRPSRALAAGRIHLQRGRQGTDGLIPI